MNQKINTVEDCLEYFVGLKGSTQFVIDKSDIGILSSIGRQIFKGVALTDRQYELVKNKLLQYKDQFYLNDVDNLEDCLQVLRNPLRQIDRTKTIKIVDNKITIRFPFSKKLMVKLEKIASKRRPDHVHEKGSHIHKFPIKESIIEEVIDIFSDNSFEIDKEIIEYYKKIKNIKNNPQDYVPCVYNGKLLNLDNEHVQTLYNKFGKPCEENLTFYKDRSLKYNLTILDYYKKDNSLLHKIANRSHHSMYIDSAKYELFDVLCSLLYLKRLPILIGISEKDAYNQLTEVHKLLYRLNPDLKHSVLFRLDNDEVGTPFNQYIKNNDLNVSLDKHVDIVYINIDSNKAPKPLVKANIEFESTLIIDAGYTGRHITRYAYNLSDCSISYSSVISPMLTREFEKI